jgi:hypothetical protein
MTIPTSDEADRAFALQDLAYHQARVLMLVDAVASTKGHSGKLDGLTKLAKLDFLVRYPALAPVVLDGLDEVDPRLNLSEAERNEPTSVESPMTRYKYGPWDDRYYPVIGALVGRGLLRYTRGRRGSVALVPTAAGRRVATRLANEATWRPVNERCAAVAEASAGLTGTGLKDLIYQRLAGLMDRAHRQVIK